jgi:hypothetical protein
VSFSSQANKGFWQSLSKVPITELAFTTPRPNLLWRGGSAVCPSTLTKVNVTSTHLAFNPIILLKQLVNLETIIVKIGRGTGMPDAEDREIRNLSLKNESIVCRRLRTFTVSLMCPQFLIDTVARQCPLLEEVTLPSNTTYEEIKVLVTQCPQIRHLETGSSEKITEHGLFFLSQAKNLVHISLPLSLLAKSGKMHILSTWIKMLPKLRSVGFGAGDWLNDEETTADNCSYLMQNGWSDSQTDVLRRYLKPTDNKIFMQLDVLAMRRDVFEEMF